MAKKYYSVMVTSDFSSKVHRCLVAKRLIKTAAVVCCCFLLAFAFLLYSYITSTMKSALLSQLQHQVTRQKIELQTYANAVNDLEKQISYMGRFDKKLRAIASLEQDSKEARLAGGIGGPTSQETEKFMAHSAAGLKAGDKLKKDLASLSKAAEEQEDSFRNLEGFFRYRKALFASTPSILPAKGWLASPFGYRSSPYTGKKEMHYGLDIAGRSGSPVMAAADGKVSYVGADNGYGNIIELDHGFGMMTRYAHNSQNIVKIGQRVKKGEIIARMGSTGRSTGPHVHFEVLINGVPVNPNRYIIEDETVLANLRDVGKRSK